MPKRKLIRPSTAAALMLATITSASADEPATPTESLTNAPVEAQTNTEDCLTPSSEDATIAGWTIENNRRLVACIEVPKSAEPTGFGQTCKGILYQQEPRVDESGHAWTFIRTTAVTGELVENEGFRLTDGRVIPFDNLVAVPIFATPQEMTEGIVQTIQCDHSTGVPFDEAVDLD